MFSWNSASLSTAASSGRPTGSSKLSPRNDTLYEGFPVKVAWWRLPGKSFLVEASRHRLLGKNFDPIVSVQSLSDLSPDSNLGVSTCIVTGVFWTMCLSSPSERIPADSRWIRRVPAQYGQFEFLPWYTITLILFQIDLVFGLPGDSRRFHVINN